MHLENLEVLNAALFYRERQLSILPAIGKKPAVPWKDLQQRLPTVGELHAWFGVVNQSRRNIAIITGRISGVAAIDLDSAETTRWACQNLPKTNMMTKSGAGRGHFFYRLPEGIEIRNRVRVKGRLIDVRGEGGYCLADPSVHPETRLRYQRFGDWDLAKLPEFPIDWIEDESSQSRPVTRKKIDHIDAYLRRIESHMGRNGSAGLVRFCAICRDSGVISEAECMAKLVEWNNGPTVLPPWSLAELARACSRTYAMGAAAAVVQLAPQTPHAKGELS